MTRVCILTDNTAQFENPAFTGKELIHVIQHSVQWQDQIYTGNSNLKIREYPASGLNGAYPRLIAPSADDFRRILTRLGQQYNEIITILLSSHLSPAVKNAKEAAATLRGRVFTWVIDSQTTAIGLGMLAQNTAQAAQSGMSGVEIVRKLYGSIPKIYSVFFTQNLMYLHHAGFIDQVQAVIGEMMGITPMLLLEKGRPVPIQKARNARHIVDILHNFITEFNTLQHIGIIQGTPLYKLEMRTLCERISKEFPGMPVSNHKLDNSLAAILGPRCLGMIAMEKDS
jgi:DegV family protein with EDD domain